MGIIRYPATALLLSALLAACGSKPALTLPTDPDERAAACYAAKLTQFGASDKNTSLTVVQVNEAAHFLLLGASTNGIAQPTKAKALAERGQALLASIAERKNAADYAEPCAKAYPETLPAAFKALPADSADTRMMCFALANALVQIYQASGVRRDDKGSAYARLNETLDTRISEEIRAGGEPNLAELAGRAVRGLALGAQAGPPTMVMDACVTRYLKP